MPSLNRYGGVTYLSYNPRPRTCRLLKSTPDNTEAHLIEHLAPLLVGEKPR